MRSAVRLRWLGLLAMVSAGLGVTVASLMPSLIGQQTAGLLPIQPLSVVPEPSLPPPRDEIAVFQPDQSVEVVRHDGIEINIAYSSVILDPGWIDLQYFAGWSRELEANDDLDALLFFTGPTFEKGHPDTPLGMVLHGDLKLSDGLIRAGNRAAAAGRAYLAVRHDGSLTSGFGPFTPEADANYRLFIGGLHAFLHPADPKPPTYKGVYGPMAMADVRILYGVRSDGRLEVVETADGVLFPDLHLFVQALGFEAALLPDHASKSRLIVPGQRHWSDEQAVWVSGGKPSITALPFMLRVVPRGGA